MTDVIGRYIQNIPDDGLTIIDVTPFPPGANIDPSSKTYRIKAVFRDAKDRTLRRMTLIVHKLKEGRTSQDMGNLAHYYLNRRFLPKFLRKRYGAKLKADGEIELRQPNGQTMPGHDVSLLAFNFAPM
ncbi:MAG: hypothetical protein K2Q32_07480 [Alphaproteobacteria bacterium]|nr:hypothetical protein [Alphaproteobacteria bacterium]